MAGSTVMKRSLKDPDGNPHWVNWSLTPHTEEELRETILHDYDAVCFSYICRYSSMSEEFIKELIVISTGIFSGDNFKYFTPENFKVVKDIMYIEPTLNRLAVQKELKSKKYPKADPEFIKVINDWKIALRSKVDWWQIANYQPNLSKEFIEEFKDKFKQCGVRSDVELERAYN